MPTAISELPLISVVLSAVGLLLNAWIGYTIYRSLYDGHRVTFSQRLRHPRATTAELVRERDRRRDTTERRR